MLKKVRNIFVCTFMLSIVIWIIALIISQKYLIRGFSLLYPLFGAIFSIAFLLIIEIIRKVNLNRIKQVIISSSIALCAFVCCFYVLGVDDMFFGSGELHAVSVENLPSDNEIYLYEYPHFRSNEGMLCIKINDIFYLKLIETKYRVELNHSLSDPKNMILNYNEKTGVLTMRYKRNEGSEYHENKITYFFD
ncbi:MAG: hypothetical protein J6B75_09145 [Ruminococcus sp.]|nr:hypothetical protein [Ruminococcus sp.]